MNFVASNLYSISEVQFLDQFTASGIYAADQWWVSLCMELTLMTIIIGFID